MRVPLPSANVPGEQSYSGKHAGRQAKGQRQPRAAGERGPTAQLVWPGLSIALPGPHAMHSVCTGCGRERSKNTNNSRLKCERENESESAHHSGERLIRAGTARCARRHTAGVRERSCRAQLHRDKQASTFSEARRRRPQDSSRTEQSARPLWSVNEPAEHSEHTDCLHRNVQDETGV